MVPLYLVGSQEWNIFYSYNDPNCYWDSRLVELQPRWEEFLAILMSEQNPQRMLLLLSALREILEVRHGG